MKIIKKDFLYRINTANILQKILFKTIATLNFSSKLVLPLKETMGKATRLSNDIETLNYFFIHIYF